MPFINSKISVNLTSEQENIIKSRLGKAIECIPGKSENWLMLNFEENSHLYFKGDNTKPSAFVDVKVYGRPDSSAFNRLTGEITTIYNDVLNIPSDRIYVAYSATPDWGYNGSNF